MYVQVFLYVGGKKMDADSIPTFRRQSLISNEAFKKNLISIFDKSITYPYLINVSQIHNQFDRLYIHTYWIIIGLLLF